MENNLLSPKVKEYFVHALKGIGIRNFDQAKGQTYEMTETEIGTFLDGATPLDIFEKISSATVHQLQNDTQGDRRLQSCSAFKRQTVSNALAGNDFKSQGISDLQKEDADRLVNEVCNFNDVCYRDVLTQSTIGILKAGINEQKVLTDADKENQKRLREEVSAIWDLISDSPRLTWNEKAPADQQLDRENYNSSIYKGTLFTKTVKILGNEDLAKKFLKSKFDQKTQDVKLKVSDQVLASAKQICQGRGGKDLITQDVMLALMLDHSVEQAITFFQTRSQEQKTLQANGNKSVTRENKLGNLMGKDGRKMVEKAAINYDKTKKSVKKGKQMWKGYKKLYDRMLGFIGSKLFSGIMVGGLTDRMLARKGIIVNQKRNVSNEKINLRPWEIEFEKMPEQLQEQNGANSAESFYKKTRARLLADKMRRANCQLNVNDPSVSEERRSMYQARVKYLDYRIAAAEDALEKISKISKDDDLLNKPEYFKQLESQILNEKFLDQYKKPVEEVEKELEQQQQDQQEQEQKPKESAEYLGVESLIKAGRDNTADEEMGLALQGFHMLSKLTQTPARKAARCSMARELFGLSTREVPDDTEVAKIADRFEQNKLSQLKMQLINGTGLKGQTNQSGVEQAFAEIQNFVLDDLKVNVFSDQYNAYLVGQNVQKVMQDVVDELSR